MVEEDSISFRLGHLEKTVEAQSQDIRDCLISLTEMKTRLNTMRSFVIPTVTGSVVAAVAIVGTWLVNRL